MRYCVQNTYRTYSTMRTTNKRISNNDDFFPRQIKYSRAGRSVWEISLFRRRFSENLRKVAAFSVENIINRIVRN